MEVAEVREEELAAADLSHAFSMTGQGQRLVQAAFPPDGRCNEGREKLEWLAPLQIVVVLPAPEMRDRLEKVASELQDGDSPS